MERPLVTVIIPVYNAENTLARCVESVLSQTFTDFELLLIDDGSRDGSAALCDEYAAKDGRVRVFHKENGGVSSARNVGLDNAQGEWLCFLDADDWFPTESLNLLQAKVADGGRAVIAGYEWEDEREKRFFTTEKLYAADFRLPKEEAIAKLLRLAFWGWFVCGKLYRKELIAAQGIRFDEGLLFGEDRLFLIKYLCAAKGDVVFSSDVTYHYQTTVSGSATTLSEADKVRSIHKIQTGFDSSIRIYETVKASKGAKYNELLAFGDIWVSYRTALKDGGALHCNIRRYLFEVLGTHFSYGKFVLLLSRLVRVTTARIPFTRTFIRMMFGE